MLPGACSGFELQSEGLPSNNPHRRHGIFALMYNGIILRVFMIGRVGWFQYQS